MYNFLQWLFKGDLPSAIDCLSLDWHCNIKNLSHLLKATIKLFRQIILQSELKFTDNVSFRLSKYIPANTFYFKTSPLKWDFSPMKFETVILFNRLQVVTTIQD